MFSGFPDLSISVKSSKDLQELMMCSSVKVAAIFPFTTCAYSLFVITRHSVWYFH